MNQPRAPPETVIKDPFSVLPLEPVTRLTGHSVSSLRLRSKDMAVIGPGRLGLRRRADTLVPVTPTIPVITGDLGGGTLSGHPRCRLVGWFTDYSNGGLELTLLLTVLELAVIEAKLLGTGHLAASHVKGPVMRLPSS